MPQRLMLTGLLLPLLLTVSACGKGGIHAFDNAQVPVVYVSSGQRPVISWRPPHAYQLNIYAGEKDGNGIGVLWNKRGGAGYENNLRSPVSDVPALPAGKTYTVTVERKDPLGSGDGFTNTRHRYVGKKTFIVR